MQSSLACGLGIIFVSLRIGKYINFVTSLKDMPLWPQWGCLLTSCHNVLGLIVNNISKLIIRKHNGSLKKIGTFKKPYNLRYDKRSYFVEDLFSLIKCNET